MKRIFTIELDEIKEGATVAPFRLKAGIVIPAITVGQEGRNRELGVLPVALMGHWEEKPTVIRHARLGQTKTGRPKLIETGPDDDDAEHDIIVVLRTPIGFRGGNSHTGDRKAWKCLGQSEVAPCGATGDGLQAPSTCPRCGGRVELTFYPFPGQVLVRGTIAQGDAGNMGAGQQLVAVIAPNTVFRAGLSGRLYGRPAAYYYRWDGNHLMVATWEERQVADLF